MWLKIAEILGSYPFPFRKLETESCGLVVEVHIDDPSLPYIAVSLRKDLLLIRLPVLDVLLLAFLPEPSREPYIISRNFL